MTENYELNIILADDDEDDREFMGMAAMKTGIQLVSLVGGEQLLEYLETSSALPDGILLDINMPRLNGIECLKHIRQKSTWKHIPVLMYTTSDIDDYIKETYELGANMFIKKPNQLKMLSQITEFLVTDKDWTTQPQSMDKYLFEYKS